jgi:hypothetical protein
LAVPLQRCRLAITLGALVACNGKTTGVPVDSGTDIGSGTDSAADVAVADTGTIVVGDGGTDASVDTGTDTGGVIVEAGPDVCTELCTLAGGEYVCSCGLGTWPECPGSADESQPCSTPTKTACMGCSEGANFTCSCTDAGPMALHDAGDLAWFCVGGGQACH